MDLKRGRAARHDLDALSGAPRAVVDGLEKAAGVLQVVELIDEDEVNVPGHGLDDPLGVPAQEGQVSRLLEVQEARASPLSAGLRLQLGEEGGLSHLPGSNQVEDVWFLELLP